MDGDGYGLLGLLGVVGFRVLSRHGTAPKYMVMFSFHLGLLVSGAGVCETGVRSGGDTCGTIQVNGSG